MTVRSNVCETSKYGCPIKKGPFESISTMVIPNFALNGEYTVRIAIMLFN